MKKLIFTFIAMLSILVFTLPVRVFAAESPTPQTITTDNHTAQEEAEGKEVWEKLQAKQTTCGELTDDNFASLGEYFMGQMLGSSHEAMNTMMERMMGKTGEQQMHITMGKRFSGCDTNASYPASGSGFIPMMSMMGVLRGGGNPMMGYWGNNMMGGWGGFGILGWFSMIVSWVLLILGVVALVRYLGGTSKTTKDEKTPLDILKERYARGDIDKKEFEEKKKDLS